MPQVSWNMDYTKVAYKGEILDIAMLREGIKQGIADVWKLMEAFTKGNRLDMSIPEDLCCDKSSSTMGDTWIRPSFTNPQILPLLSKMDQLGTWALTKVDQETGKPRWIIAECDVFMNKMKDIICLLGFLNYFVPGPPGRGTELVLDRIYNAQVKRNFYMDFGWMLIARRYSKTSGIAGHDNLTVSFMPKQLAEVNQYYQLFFRPVEQLIATELYTTQEAAHYHEFMYVLAGKRWTAEQFRAYIPQASAKYFGSKLKVSYLRHMLIAVKRAFIPPMLTDIFQDIGDRMSAHSTEIANAWYAVEDALEGKTITFMSDTRDWCKKYHNVLGVGESEDTPIPIRLHGQSPAKSAAAFGSSLLPSDGDIAQLQQVIIRMFTGTAQELKLHLTQEMQEAIYSSIALATTSLQVQTPLPPPSSIIAYQSSIPPAYRSKSQPPVANVVDLTQCSPTPLHMPRLVQQQPKTAFGDTSFLLSQSPIQQTDSPPSPQIQLPPSSDKQRGRSKEWCDNRAPQSASRDSSSGSRKRKMSPNPHSPHQEIQDKLAGSIDEQSNQLPGIPLSAMSELSISLPTEGSQARNMDSMTPVSNPADARDEMGGDNPKGKKRRLDDSHPAPTPSPVGPTLALLKESTRTVIEHLEALSQYCPICWIEGNKSLQPTSHAEMMQKCQQAGTFSRVPAYNTGYFDWKRGWVYELAPKFDTFCAMPTNIVQNYGCHKNFPLGKRCPYANIQYSTAWIIFHRSDLFPKMAESLGYSGEGGREKSDDTSRSEYRSWLCKLNLQRERWNLMDVFLWGWKHCGGVGDKHH